MTIYYTAVFFILVTEMLAFGALVVPLPSRWRRVLFKFVSTSPLVTKAIHILKIVFGFIFVLFIDAVNRLQRIEESQPDKSQHHDYAHEASLKASRFYAQRNLYLTGFTLFLSLILERTSTLVVAMLQHEEQLEYAKEEHSSSKNNHSRLVELENDYKKQIDTLTQELEELKKESRDIELLKQQVAQQSEEYHQLAVEKNLLATEPKKTI